MSPPKLSIACTAALLVIASARPGVSAAPEPLGGCQLLPSDNIWNTAIDSAPIDARSAQYIASIGAATTLHPDFGTTWLGAPIGIPFAVVPASQPLVDITVGPAGWPDQSDPGPMPIPPDAPVEGGAAANGDRHVLVLRQGECKLYELYRAQPLAGGRWQVDNASVYDLASNALRPDTWTSADAAGLPMLPGLARYDETQSGEIRHAIRFTADITRGAHVWPARHDASNNSDPARPPMGQRFRLKAAKDLSAFPAQARTLFTAFKKYGLILADNGSNWYVGGAHDMRWDDDALVSAFGQLRGSDFEAVDVSALRVNADSGQVRASTPFTPTRFIRVPVMFR